MSVTTTTIGGATRIDGVRNARYGEVFLIGPGEQGRPRAEVYNTIGLNDCPLELWSALDAQTVARDAGVPAAWLNGPRFWLMDQITVYKVGDVRSFNGLDARWVATLELPPGLDLHGVGPERFYRDTMINRDTEWLFRAGQPIHELVDPDGRTYVMQAYAHIVDESQTMESLAGLGERLQLPRGWTYRTRTPERDVAMRTATGEAHILQDELENTYMQLTS